ncbi:GDSL-type esterase/lipase family protein [bacterium]|jgi:lysophospholipase L1-like esterase|nr:GDSL-type esterase/lipase family protein [bacterium]MDA7680623.1 GDSL-type esterase/lipase family protein [bacterium]
MSADWGLRFRDVIRLCVWVLVMGGAESQGSEIELTIGKGPVVRPPESSEEWFRLERTTDFQTWEIGRDSVAWPTEVAAHRKGVEFNFFRFLPLSIPDPPYSIGIVGDSTAVGIQQFPLARGWAQELSAFTQDETRFVMAGDPGLSTKSFFGSFRERMLTTTTPIVVLVQLGQIDEFNGQSEVKSTTLKEYRENLASIVSLIRGWKGTPILVSPLAARLFEEDGRLVPYLVERSAAVREVADEVGAYMIDLHQLTSNLYLNGTDDEVRNWGYGDDYHLSVAGAEKVARLVLSALPPHLKNHFFVEPEVE